MRNRPLFYYTQDDEYRSLSRDAAELYLFRRELQEAKNSSSRLVLFIVCASITVASFLLLLLF